MVSPKDFFWSVFGGIIGGTLVVLSFKIWEARARREEAENQNGRVESIASGLKQAEEHDDRSC